MNRLSRRELLRRSLGAAGCLFASAAVSSCKLIGPPQPQKPGSKIRFGLVTYLWAKDWDLPTIIRNCKSTRVYGVELRTHHAHNVEAVLNSRQRQDVRKRFDDSPVTLVGLGTNFAFHYSDPAELKKNIEGARQYIKLSHDVGGSGVKVKPNALPSHVPVEKTIEQIASSLNDLGRFAEDHGQEIRVEVHGRETSKLPIMKRIFDLVERPNVGICWNSNPQDLDPPGLEYNFNLVKDRFGATAHVRELNIGNYPYQQLINLFVKMDYKGWILLEARTNPADKVKALAEQRLLFEKMVARAQALL